jgi:hypothetical protein
MLFMQFSWKFRLNFEQEFVGSFSIFVQARHVARFDDLDTQSNNKSNDILTSHKASSITTNDQTYVKSHYIDLTTQTESSISDSTSDTKIQHFEFDWFSDAEIVLCLEDVFELLVLCAISTRCCWIRLLGCTLLDGIMFKESKNWQHRTKRSRHSYG